MDRRLLNCLVVVLLLAAAPVLAQTTGSIRGQVVASEGGVLPGVTVTVESEVLMGGQRSAVTGGNGTYNFAALPLGVYSVTASLDGHQTQRTENVRVNMNVTASVDFALPPVFSEEVMVTAETPLVDMTTSSVSSNYEAEFMEDLPTTRNFWDLMAVSPGVSQSEEGSPDQVAFGSALTANSWQIDGVETALAGGGYSWLWTNPDFIQEVQVLGVGASAEFGNFTGAAFNVVTKSGTNEFHGALNAYFQTDSLTDTNVELEDTEYPSFVRDQWHDITATLGGPIKRDRLWFFIAGEDRRSASTPPGVNPAFASTNVNERYDIKLNARINDSNMIDAKAHFESWKSPWQGDPYYTQDALGSNNGDQPGWGLSWQSILSDRTFFEVKYAGWDSSQNDLSLTGSTADPYAEKTIDDYDWRYSEGKYWPWYWDTGRNQADATLSHFADDFIAGDHEFKFGVQYGDGYEWTTTAPGPRGVYYYGYGYYYYYEGYPNPYYFRYDIRVTQRPFYYGNEQNSIAAFVDDSWTISPNFTLNLGVRWDRHNGWIPAYPRLDMDWQPTGETIPGAEGIDWSHVSPRLGFAWNPHPKTTIRGSYGIYYGGNIGGDWNYPAPGAPTIEAYAYNWETGEYDIFWWDWGYGDLTIDPNLKAPMSTQYSLGFERQVGKNMAIGVQLLFKEVQDHIGWEILGDGNYEEVPFTDPFTGTEYILWNQIEQASAWKGNRPGVTANPDADEYWQEYRGLFLTFKKRLSNSWSMMASYTYSESEGLIPLAKDGYQGWTIWGSRQGTDPNEWINAEQLLQGDRPHMFTLQANVLLPWGMHASTMINIQSGRPYSRQYRVTRLNQGDQNIIMRPGDDDHRMPSSAMVDLAWGKRFNLGQKVGLLLDLQLLNALNEDAWDYWRDLVIQEGEDFVPATDTFFLPRRLQVRIGIEF